MGPVRTRKSTRLDPLPRGGSKLTLNQQPKPGVLPQETSPPACGESQRETEAGEAQAVPVRSVPTIRAEGLTRWLLPQALPSLKGRTPQPCPLHSPVETRV